MLQMLLCLPVHLTARLGAGRQLRTGSCPVARPVASNLELTVLDFAGFMWMEKVEAI